MTLRFSPREANTPTSHAGRSHRAVQAHGETSVPLLLSFLTYSLDAGTLSGIRAPCASHRQPFLLVPNVYNLPAPQHREPAHSWQQHSGFGRLLQSFCYPGKGHQALLLWKHGSAPHPHSARGALGCVAVLYVTCLQEALASFLLGS